MVSQNPALWENGQYLNEWDREHNDRYSEAAKKAQEAKWKRLMANRPPRDALPNKLLPRPGQKLPLYHYGFPFTYKYAIEYARRHHLTIPLAEEDRETFGGQAVLDMAELDDARLAADEDIRVFAKSVSRNLMVRDLSRRCGYTLDTGRPFSMDWDGIVSLWTNYDVEERFVWCYDHKKVVDILKGAMNETEWHNSLKAQWWFDWDNDVGLFTSVN
ncbi:hypothetical protein DICSQDRAFT_180597 [Dichomitus squalens LYAD-421 SS1]|uniref:Uncharacterized protein n=2 Tax=Dichomitus squalens TaxID=114155 RepID=A0A4Q9PSB1_9APHY|nr:uncharacterized protein DICSQDRAFT_180597 [Dichomitus squalens LYAD-421 SS1]EJF61578.1 hypothetical protein DICSQDRAFT_180597 [Dichomitus squalens LYAD-421 SS1]TBU28185.1 hypothetical protein BD311DRAFT_739500 [Dichomitus squalens]TBU57302.1 hypothetical protein BD310DRAFT_821938 [Dichomitus squalens]